MQKIEVHIKNTEKWIKLIQEDLELINDKEDYLHGHYITPDIDESEITVFKGFVEEDIVKIIYIYEKNPFNINEVEGITGDYIESIDKLTNIEIVDSAGCTYDEYVSYMILEINKDISIKRIKVKFDRKKFIDKIMNLDFPDKNNILKYFYGIESLN